MSLYTCGRLLHPNDFLIRGASSPEKKKTSRGLSFGGDPICKI